MMHKAVKIFRSAGLESDGTKNKVICAAPNHTFAAEIEKDDDGNFNLSYGYSANKTFGETYRVYQQAIDRVLDLWYRTK